ncbi:MAG TPA: O-antigen ligase family protein, partial [Longimicrobiales bacterium]|nr:O-antigen ligase family protein [Longimicrobiales bacterium]
LSIAGLLAERVRGTTLLGILGGLALMLATLSRAALASAAIMTLVVFYAAVRWPDHRAALRTICLLLLAVGLATAAVLQVDAIRERLDITRFGSVQEAALSGQFTSGRAILWVIVANAGMSEPLFGHGTGNVMLLLGRSLSGDVLFPHNEFLRLFYDGGFIGAGLLAACWIGRATRHLRGLNRTRRRDSRIAMRHLAALNVSIGVLCGALFDNVLLYMFVQVPAFMVLAIADSSARTNDMREPVGHFDEDRYTDGNVD